MNILVIAETYPPVLRASARMMQDLALEFGEMGHSVDVITMVENSEEYKGLETAYFKQERTQVLRIRTLKLRNVSFIRRAIAEELIPYAVNYKSCRYLGKKSYDLIVAYSPPINIYKVIKKYKDKSKCKVYLILRDIHPQTGKDLGIIKNELIFNFYRKKEKKLYVICDYIAAQSPANKKFLLDNNGIDEKKVDVIYNWKRKDKPKQVDRVDYRKIYGLEGKSICLYGGNMSISQDLMELLDLAGEVSCSEDAVFLIIGFGPQRDMLMEEARRRGLKNVRFEKPLSLEEYDSLVMNCDIGIIHLNRSFKTQNFPGKLLDYMNAGIPVVAAVNPGNDIDEIIGRAECGYVCESGDLPSFKEKLLRLLRDRDLRLWMGANGKEYLQRNFSAEQVCKKIIEKAGKQQGDFETKQ